MRCRFVFIVAAVILLTGPVAARAAIFTVNTTADTYDGVCNVVDCSLKDAVDDAVATAGADVIVLAANATYTISTTIVFSWGLPQITDDVTVVGNGAVVERDPSGPDLNLFRTNGTGKLTLQNLTVRNGRDDVGGCIENHFGALHVVDSVLENCVATQANGQGGAAIHSNGVGPVTITRTTIRNNSSLASAGAVQVSGLTYAAQLTIVDSAFIGNSTLDAVNGLGGALQLTGDVDATITSSTFSGNTSASLAGAIGFNGVPVGHTIDLLNDTIVRNTAYVGGGLGANACSQNCPNVTKPRLINTILANNTSTVGPLSANCQSTYDSGGNNILGPPVVNNVNCTILNQTNEILLTGGLANMSGLLATGLPGGEHHDLLSGNVGIDNANASCPSTDQLGYGRVVVCERGAIEYRPPVISPCQAVKKRCIRDKVQSLLTCHWKAEKVGTPVSLVCLQKGYQKFTKCCDKAEHFVDCPTPGDCDALEAKVDAFVVDVVEELDPGYPTPVQNLCSSKKKKCVMKKAMALLACHAKAEEIGALSPKCVDKARFAFDGGALPSKSCFYPLENNGNCLTTGDTAAMEAKVDAFIDDVVCELDPTTGYCHLPTPIATPTATPTPTETPTPAPTPTATATP